MPQVFCKTARAWVTLLYVATASSSLQTFGLQMVTYGWPCLPHLWLPYPGVWKACWCLFARKSGPEIRFRCHFPGAVCVVFFETGSLSLAWGSLNRLGWLHVSPREMPVSIVTVFELKAGRQLWLDFHMCFGLRSLACKVSVTQTELSSTMVLPSYLNDCPV